MEALDSDSNCVAMSNLFVNPTSFGVYCVVNTVLAREEGCVYNTCCQEDLRGLDVLVTAYIK